MIVERYGLSRAAKHLGRTWSEMLDEKHKDVVQMMQIAGEKSGSQLADEIEEEEDW